MSVDQATGRYILTNSELTSFQHCPRCWYLGYYRCLSKLTDYKKTLSVGTLYHNALEGYYGGTHDAFEYVKTKSIAMIEANPEAAESLAKDAELVGIMVEGYFEWLAEEGADADLEVLSSEEKIDIDLTERYILRGKLDARVLRRSSGMSGFLEHKTVPNLVDLPRTAQTNPQFRTYSMIEYVNLVQMGLDASERTDGLILNMARKVKRTARAKPPFYKREDVRYNVHELRAHWQHTIGTADRIMATRARLDAGESIHAVVPPVNTRECFWKCSFSSLCMSGMMDDGSDWEGYVADLYEVIDPLQRYEEEEGEHDE